MNSVTNNMSRSINATAYIANNDNDKNNKNKSINRQFDDKQENSQNELLQFALDNGILDLSYVQEQIDMVKRSELLAKHNYSIWQGKDGNWYTHVPDKEKGRVLKKRKSKEEIEDIIVAYWKEEAENPTIEEVFTEWNDRRLELAKISGATHLRNTQVFNRHYKEFGKYKIKSISEEDFEDFLEEQIPKYDLTAKAFSNLKSVTKGFLKRAKKRKLVNYNVEEIFQDLDTSDTDFKHVIKEDYEEVFSEDETPVIMDYLVENLDVHNTAILLMFLTGARTGEIVTLKHSDFNGNTFNVRRTETKYKDESGKYVFEVKEFPKTKAGVRTCIIPKDYEFVVQRIKRLNPFSDYIFVNQNGKRMSTYTIRSRLKRICKKLNIYNKSPHKIRKTYGTILLDNGIDNRLVEQVMGHTDITCTETRYHRNRRTLDKKGEIISAIPDFKLNESDKIKKCQ